MKWSLLIAFACCLLPSVAAAAQNTATLYPCTCFLNFKLLLFYNVFVKNAKSAGNAAPCLTQSSTFFLALLFILRGFKRRLAKHSKVADSVMQLF